MKRRGSHLENISMARFAFSCDSWKLHKHNWTSRTRTWSVGPFGFPGPSMPPIGERQGGNPDSNSPEPWGNRINELGMSAQSLQVCLFVTPWTIAHQAPLSMRFSRQEYWSGFPLPSPEDLPNPGIHPHHTPPLSPALQADSLRLIMNCRWINWGIKGLPITVTQSPKI